jgi:hypothetical protein
MNRRKSIVTLIVILVLSVILGGFVYAHIDKVYLFNQTKTQFQSLGFHVSDMPVYVPEVQSVQSIADFSAFISIARQNNITTVFVGGYSFYIFASSTEYRYTPCNSIWWIWG